MWLEQITSGVEFNTFFTSLAELIALAAGELQMVMTPKSGLRVLAMAVAVFKWKLKGK